jgi:uracil-DNA glycosylase
MSQIKSLVSDLKCYLSSLDDEDLTGVASTKSKGEKKMNDSEKKESKKDSSGDKRALLDNLAKEVAKCRKCHLGHSRLNSVFGVGNPDTDVMFVGEGPGYEEDHRGEPFVGKAGKLLDKIICAMSLSREKVYIANIVKCHPMVDSSNPELRSNDRAPVLEEISACRPYLDKQIEIIKPKFIVALGSVAAKSLLNLNSSLGAMRRKFHEMEASLFSGADNIRILATFHPAALLRNPSWKKDTWDDMKMLMKELGLKECFPKEDK